MELRILSGLHRGAVMELDADAGEITIGASPLGDFDVLLADAGIANRHCSLGWTGGRLQLEPLEGKVHDAQGRAVTASTVVERGRTYRLGDIWIGFFHEGDPSTEAPAVVQAPRTGRYPRNKASIIAVALVAALLPAGWFASMAWGSVARLAQPGTAELIAQVPPPIADANPSPAKLAEEFTRALVERDLRDRLDLQLHPDHWEIRGSLDADERQRFERLLVRFTETRKPGFPIKVGLVTPAELLPFKVVEVITGKGAAIVMDSGERLQVGEAYQGWKLVSVDAAKVVFSGKQRVEVAL
ncbi:MAG TPA: FHA domain-containing protein [Rhizobacter sp.]|nr:FHA domain-containing protein [Rhizobacter sp.]